MCTATEFEIAISYNSTFLRFLNLLVRLCPFLTSRFMGQWVSPGGCGWRTPSMITSTTRNISSCKKNRQVFFFSCYFFVLFFKKNCLVWHLGSRVPVAENKHSWNSHEELHEKKSLLAAPALFHLCQTLQSALFLLDNNIMKDMNTLLIISCLIISSSHLSRFMKSVIKQISPVWD